VANDTWLTQDHVVRISKDPEYLEDLFTESIAAPAAIASGIRTPKLVTLELQSKLDMPPYSVWEFVPGLTLADVKSMESPEQFFTSYGELLRRIHEMTIPDDPHGYLDEAWLIEPETLVEGAEAANLKKPVVSLLDRVEPAPHLCFTHQDLHAENVLLDGRGLPVVLDWGDAGLGDPAVDFRFIPIQFVERALAGYGDDSPSLVGRILLHQWDQLFYAQASNRSYGPFGESSLEGLAEATGCWLGHV